MIEDINISGICRQHSFFKNQDKKQQYFLYICSQFQKQKYELTKFIAILLLAMFNIVIFKRLIDK